MKKYILFACLFYNIFSASSSAGILVLQSDFGAKDAAVAEIKGTALSVDEHIVIVDNTHMIEPFDIWEGAYRLYQSIGTFPKNTVFVSVVDPGVGTSRKSIVVKTKDDHYIVTPDNGTITFIDKEIGIAEARVIDETRHRVAFYGRDVYVYTGAKLASGKISFEDVGDELDIKKLKRLDHQQPEFKKGTLHGNIPILDVNYGNVWTNIDRKTANKIKLKRSTKYDILITDGIKNSFISDVVYDDTFGNVPEGKPVLYFNSLGYLSVGLNVGNFAKAYGVKYGPNWKISISKAK